MYTRNSQHQRQSAHGGGITFAVLATGIALSSFCSVGTAQAQSNNAADEAIDEIVVTTARRREESILEVPVSISVFSGDDLERIGAVDIIAVAQASPNVTLEVSRGTNSTLTAFIRGKKDHLSIFNIPARTSYFIIWNITCYC